MNGLLTICKKKDSPTELLKGLLSKGLKSLYHRGNKTHNPFLFNKDFQNANNSETAQIIAGSCTGDNVASHNGNILFFEGRLINKNELSATITKDNISEAEIVIQLLGKYGVDCLKSLKGFWTLIYIDAKSKTVYGARDHFGNRPLYFCNTEGQFALASESRTLYSLFEDARGINKNTVIDFLLWGNIGSIDQYFFKNIHSVEPSHYVKYEMESNKLTVERYYTLGYNRSKTSYSSLSEQQYINKLHDLISDTVRKNINLFDDPLAVGVSGGMDSSTLICTAKKTNPDKTLVAYTATDNYDGGEASWAEKIVRHTGAEWIKVVCTSEQIIEKTDYANRFHSCPVYNASSLTQFLIMEKIKSQGQAVSFDGQGGDEMLGGYPEYFPLFLSSLRKNGEWKNWKNELSQTGNSGISKKEIVTRRLKLWAKKCYYTPRVLAQKKRKPEFESLMPQVRDNYFNEPSPIPQIKKEILNDALFESYTVFLGNILRWGEHSAASQGIECVMPLSDSLDLTEFIFSIPSSFKIHDGWNKYLLRKAMVGTVPDEICWRKQKMGFYIPEQNWLNEMDKAMFDVIEKLDDPEECINKKYILNNRHRLYSSDNYLYQRFIFRCYSYLQWRNGLPD